MKKSKEGLTVKKLDNFSEWYTQVIQKADLIDYSKVSGCLVFKPSSYVLWESAKEYFNKKIKKDGVENVYFPLFIPEKLLKKESLKFSENLGSPKVGPSVVPFDVEDKNVILVPVTKFPLLSFEDFPVTFIFLVTFPFSKTI